MSARYGRVGSARLPVQIGDCEVMCAVHAYRRDDGGDELIALVHGDDSGHIPIVRVHSGCVTGDVLGSVRCDCRFQLQQALTAIASAPFGILIYLNTQEGRGIGLADKIRAYQLQDDGRDTVDANAELGLAIDDRTYDGAVDALRDLGVEQVRLMSNNPAKIAALAQAGIAIVERIPATGGETIHNLPYLKTKRDRMNHMLELGQ